MVHVAGLIAFGVLGRSLRHAAYNRAKEVQDSSRVLNLQDDWHDESHDAALSAASVLQGNCQHRCTARGLVNQLVNPVAFAPSAWRSVMQACTEGDGGSLVDR